MIPAGTLDPFAARPRLSHAVTITRAFAAAKYPVSRKEYAEFVLETGYPSPTACLSAGSGLDRDWRDPGYRQSTADPVTCISLNDARAYIRWLSAKTGKPYRLLSGDEWAYAVPAGEDARASPKEAHHGPNRFDIFSIDSATKEWTACSAAQERPAGGGLAGGDGGLNAKPKAPLVPGDDGSRADIVFRLARAL